jgi:GrpB-like predicted nucleotidyltransferase (UPF0157 family)
MWKNAIATRDSLWNHPRELKEYAKIKKRGAEVAKGKEGRI